MSCEPPFMRQLEMFYAEAATLQSAGDWQAFATRWLDQSAWPKREPPAQPHLTPEFARLLADDPRRWQRSFYAYDLTPLARYHFNVIFLGIGFALRFPHLANVVDKTGRGWTRCCAYCELWTSDPGDAPCPVCARALLHEYVED